MADGITVIKRQATLEEFLDMRRSVGWKIPKTQAVLKGLENSFFSVCAEKDGLIVGYGRVTGDGWLSVYIQDIMVKPEFQRSGVGLSVVSAIIEHLNENCPEGMLIGLMAAKGKEKFYEKFGFIQRPNDDMGCGMVKYIKKD